MSRYAQINDDEPAFFASNSGWSEVIDWTDNLPAKKCPNLIHLAEHGYSENLPKLVKEIAVGLAISKPDDNVAKTLKELSDLLKDEAGIVMITSG